MASSQTNRHPVLTVGGVQKHLTPEQAIMLKAMQDLAAALVRGAFCLDCGSKNLRVCHVEPSDKLVYNAEVSCFSCGAQMDMDEAGALVLA